MEILVTFLYNNINNPSTTNSSDLIQAPSLLLDLYYEVQLHWNRGQ
jgi:hypothetical protein